MSEENSECNRAMSSGSKASDHSDEDSDVIADWTLVSKDGELQDTSGDDSSSISGSSIEVMSLEDDETDLDLGESSSPMTPLAAEARTPMFILRVPSNEKALKALTMESDESDESEQIEDSNVPGLQTEENVPAEGSKKRLQSYTAPPLSEPEKSIEREITGDFQTEVISHLLESDISSGHASPDSVKSEEGEITDKDVEKVTVSCLDEEKSNQPCNGNLDVSNITEKSKEGIAVEETEIIRSEFSATEANESPQSSISLPEVISMSEVYSEGEGHLPSEGEGQKHSDDSDPEIINPSDNLPGHENDNIINQILEKEVKEEEDMDQSNQDRGDEDPQIPELQVEHVRENDLDPIVINGHMLPHGDQRYYYDVEQDDPETESSTEMDVHDDRIESDQSELQTTDNSNQSNVDISDLMENIHVNRQYLHHPKPWIDVFLNAAVVLVISVAVGMGIGHNLGSVPSWKINPQKTISCHRNVDDFIHHTILDQKLDRCERKLVSREETLNKRYAKIFQENQKLKDEANSLKNEVYDLRSEVIRLKYKKSQEIALQDVKRRRESLMSVLVRANHLEQENSDLRLEIGRLKYGHHGNQKIESLQGEGMNMEQEQAKEKTITYDPCSKVTSLKNELNIERERSEMWRNLYKDKVEEIKKKKQEEENNTNDVFGCMKLMLNNLSLPLNLSKNIEEKWRKLQNVSLNSFVEILKSFVNPKKKENGSSWSSGNKKSQTRWSDAVKDALNKTRESMSDVTQQIQDTWKQVKNLSHDLWKKHEPTVTEHLRKVQETMHQATQHLKDRFGKSKWFSKKRKGRKHKGDRKNQDHSDRREESGKDEDSFKASTKRRGFHDGKHKVKKQNKHHGNNKCNKKLNKQYKKLHNKMKNLDFDQFEKFSCKKRKKTSNTFSKICDKFHSSLFDEIPGMWFGCQRSWWSNVVRGQISWSVLPECIPHLFNWQFMVNDCQHCHKKCEKNRQGDRDHKNYKNKSKKHGHNRKKSKFHRDFEHGHQESAGKHFEFSDYEKNKDHSGYYQQSGNTDENKPEQVADDLPGLVFDEVTEDNKKPNLTEFNGGHNEDYWTCDPDDKVCTNEEKNWYLRQMEQRKYERHHQYIPDGKGDWMFKRAEERDFERTTPDDWYFRRLNDENKHEPPPAPQRPFTMHNSEECFEEDGHISCIEW